MVGGFTGPGIKTVIPRTASAKLSARIVPGQHPQRVFEMVRGTSTSWCARLCTRRPEYVCQLHQGAHFSQGGCYNWYALQRTPFPSPHWMCSNMLDKLLCLGLNRASVQCLRRALVGAM